MDNNNNNQRTLGVFPLMMFAVGVTLAPAYSAYQETSQQAAHPLPVHFSAGWSAVSVCSDFAWHSSNSQ